MIWQIFPVDDRYTLARNLEDIMNWEQLGSTSKLYLMRGWFEYKPLFREIWVYSYLEEATLLTDRKLGVNSQAFHANF